MPESEFKREKHTVLLTGAGRGLGLELTNYYLEHTEHDLVLLCFHECPKVDKKYKGRTIVYKKIDFLERKGLYAKFSKIFEEHSNIRTLVNNAAITDMRIFEHSKDADHCLDIMQVNFNGAVMLTKLFLKNLEGEGHLVNIASVVSYSAITHNTCYVASKHALLGYKPPKI